MSLGKRGLSSYFSLVIKAYAIRAAIRTNSTNRIAGFLNSGKSFPLPA